ncbi:unnamed protein product, partial [Adineta steineri]
ERMLSVIIENNPQLLEITANMSMGMPTYPSNNHRRQSVILSNEIENKPTPVEQPLTSNESTLLSINKQLHEYIDSLLLQILLHNPTLLEKH